MAVIHSIALVTGAGGALGRAVTLRLAHHGVSKIAGLDINQHGLNETKEALREQTSAVDFFDRECDISSEESVKGAIDEVVSRFGAMHYCVNNAGIGQPLKPTGETDSADLDRVMSVNFKGVWLCQKYELQQMLAQEARGTSSGSIAERGSIVNISSTLGLMAMPNLGIYTSSKHAILGLTRTDAIDYARKGIRVNAVCPGFIDTPLLLEETRKALAPSIDRIPQGRLAQAKEVADAVCFLSGSMATHITGVTLPVDGGFTAT